MKLEDVLTISPFKVRVALHWHSINGDNMIYDTDI